MCAKSPQRNNHNNNKSPINRDFLRCHINRATYSGANKRRGGPLSRGSTFGKPHFLYCRSASMGKIFFHLSLTVQKGVETTRRKTTLSNWATSDSNYFEASSVGKESIEFQNVWSFKRDSFLHLSKVEISWIIQKPSIIQNIII